MSTLGLAALQGGSTAGGAFNESQAIRAQAEQRNRVDRFNATLADFNAEDAIRRGQIEVERSLLGTRALSQRTRASVAAGNVVVDRGSARDIQAQLAAAGLEDAVTIQNNAFRRAFGSEIDAINARARGEFTQIAARSQSFQTLATGGLNVARQLGRGIIASKDRDEI